MEANRPEEPPHHPGPPAQINSTQPPTASKERIRIRQEASGCYGQLRAAEIKWGHGCWLKWQKDPKLSSLKNVEEVSASQHSPRARAPRPPPNAVCKVLWWLLFPSSWGGEKGVQG